MKMLFAIIVFLAIAVNIVAFFAEKKMKKKLAKLAEQKNQKE